VTSALPVRRRRGSLEKSVSESPAKFRPLNWDIQLIRPSISGNPIDPQEL
jgi:hypothetical protein